MKTISILTFAVILAITIGSIKVCNSQTVAIGHVTAEVIESISAASNAVTNFEIGSTAGANSRSFQKTFLTSETIDLGAITLNSGNNITCSVVMKSANLSDHSGNGFTLSPETRNNTYAMAAQQNGSQTIQLNGVTSRNNTQAPGQYEGSYTVVFAYN